MQPVAVGGGQAALAALQAAKAAGHSFQLVLLDEQMPGMDGFSVATHILETSELADATIMMLSSAGLRGDAARCREMGIAAYLTKPVTQTDLLAAIHAALGQAGAGAPVLVTRHSLHEHVTALHILLAEDNAINQHLAVKLLEKAGHRVTVANNGIEALGALTRGTFDLILMDMQMPEMGGVEATIRIREQERQHGGHIAIIAMTANATQKDRENCLEAGMDGYLSKPLQPRKMFETIDFVLAGKSIEKTSAAQVTESVADEFDYAAALANADPEVLQIIGVMFIEDSPRFLQNIDLALTSGNADELRRAAHTLKGLLGNFSTGPALEIAAQLEELAQSRELAEAPVLAARLIQEIGRLLIQMRRYFNLI
jgi:CheY-like chemotaxis protein